jgi:uncharacterized surface protein with fasciclin (FAS1) repeats
MSNITQVVNEDKNMTTLKKSVIASGLDKTLSGTGPFTIFAPTDIAFEKMNKSVLENLLKPEHKARLTDVLNEHIVAGKIAFKDFKDGEKLRTVNGKELLVHVKDGNVSVAVVKIHAREGQASNGVVYSLDDVMIKN